MAKILYHLVTVFLFSLILLNCTSPNESNPIIDQSESYTPLYKGMEKEYISAEDSIQIFSDIVGNVIREDGQQLFILEERSIHFRNDERNYNRYYRYQYFNDGFLYETSIVKREDQSNPFWETIFAKANPQNGESWELNPNNMADVNFKVSSEYIGDMKTPAGIFQNVYCFQFVDSVNFEYPDTFKTFYAKGVGNIAKYSGGIKTEVNYVKTENAEYGERIIW